MPNTKTIALLAAGLAFAGTASATNDFAFDYTFDTKEVQTEEGAARTVAELEEQISDHCQTRKIFPQTMRRVVTGQCVDTSLKRAVAMIDTPEMDQAFQDWQAKH
ncbi:MAG: UrcA family protein [Hyphomonadaceae bacterium]|nr:UrcA family protein [Hyphomonadaceae bacterium]